MTPVKIVHNKLLGGWYVVRGPHHFPLSGKFDTREEAQAWITKRYGFRQEDTKRPFPRTTSPS